MRSTLTAMAVAAGLLGFGAAAQAAPAGALPGLAGESPIVQVQMHMRPGHARPSHQMRRRGMHRRAMPQYGRAMRHGGPARHGAPARHRGGGGHRM